MSVLAGVNFSQTSVICFSRGFSCCPFYRGVSYSGVYARRELTVTGSDCSSLSHKKLKSAIFKGFSGEENLKCVSRLRILPFFFNKLSFNKVKTTS